MSRWPRQRSNDCDEIAQRRPRLGLELLGPRHAAGRFQQGHAGCAGAIVQQFDGRIAKAALGHVDDALEGEIVGRLVHEAQISKRIADFGALVEARAADHPIGQSEGDEAVFELAHLERGAHQDGDLVERVALPLQLFDVFADRARLLLGIPGRRDGDFLAVLVFGAQRLAEAAFVVSDQVRRRCQDMAG